MERPSGKEGASVAVEREALKVPRDPNTRTIAELQKRYDAVARELEELRRERDALKQQTATGGASSGAAATQLAEAHHIRGSKPGFAAPRFRVSARALHFPIGVQRSDLSRATISR